ncbi:MAG: ABC transporter ATP-binding protein/permease [Pseudomonadota bacterium]
MQHNLNLDTHTPHFGTLKTLLPYLWPKDAPRLKLRLVIIFVMLGLAKLLIVLVPIFYKYAVDALTTTDVPALALPLFPILAYGGARVLSLVFNELKDALFSKLGQRAVRQVALTTFKHLHQLSLRFHLDRKTGGLSTAIERGTRAIRTVLRFSTFNIFPTMFEITFVCITLAILYEPIFSLVTFITLTFYIIFTICITQWRTKFIRKMNREESQANAKSIDSLLNFETVKYFNNEQWEADRYDASLKCYEQSAIKGEISLAFLNVGQGIIIAAGLTVIMILAAVRVLNQTMTVGDFVLVNTYLIQLYQPLNILGFAYREIKLALVDMEQMFAYLGMKQEIRDIPQAKPLSITKGSVVFDRVNFAYDPRRPILRDLSFQVPAGKTLAIVGPSGAGKSTISRLLFRFYQPTSGAILIDDQEIQTVTQRSLRQAIGIVPQDTVLFNDTVEYNIAYGRPTATHSEVERAARHAHISDFIQSLPDGFKTMVGERGLKLSGGEKQRIAIARTLLKQPSIFLFDEATSALDTRTEKDIQTNLKEVSAHHTTLIIAHRLSTVVDADEIIVLDQGRIAERGTHQNLLDQKGLYEQMWKRQQQKVGVNPELR